MIDETKPKKLGRPRSDVVRKVFSMFGTPDEKYLLKILFNLMTNRFVEDEDLLQARKFFNRVRCRWGHLEKGR